MHFSYSLTAIFVRVDFLFSQRYRICYGIRKFFSNKKLIRIISRNLVDLNEYLWTIISANRILYLEVPQTEKNETERLFTNVSGFYVASSILLRW